MSIIRTLQIDKNWPSERKIKTESEEVWVKEAKQLLLTLSERKLMQGWFVADGNMGRIRLPEKRNSPLPTDTWLYFGEYRLYTLYWKFGTLCVLPPGKEIIPLLILGFRAGQNRQINGFWIQVSNVLLCLSLFLLSHSSKKIE